MSQYEISEVLPLDQVHLATVVVHVVAVGAGLVVGVGIGAV